MKSYKLWLESMKNSYSSYSTWKKKCRERYGQVEFEGDKDICNAFINNNGRKGIGDWDGEKGIIYDLEDAPENKE